jgi:hypothetical protein
MPPARSLLSTCAFALLFLGSGSPGRTEGSPPDTLWHLMIFYTAGELTREAYAGHGTPGYVPYAERTGMYRRVGGWDRYRQAMDHHWKEFLAGRIDRATAADRIAAEILGSAEKPGPLRPTSSLNDNLGAAMKTLRHAGSWRFAGLV